MIRYDVCVQYSGKYAPKELDLKVTVEHDIKYRRTTNPTLTFNQVFDNRKSFIQINVLYNINVI